MIYPPYLLAISFDNTLRRGRLLSLANPRVTDQLILVRTDIGRQAEGIVAAGGLLPDEMVLDLITTKLDTLKENASIFSSSLCHVWLTRGSIELDSRWLSTHAATGKAVRQFPRVSRAAFTDIQLQLLTRLVGNTTYRLI